MTAYRLQRLFHPVSQRTLIVAIDHALFNNSAFLEGIERMQEIVGKVAQANADGVLLSPGEAHHLQRLPGRGKPALMLRADPANFYSDTVPGGHLHCRVFDNAVELALRLVVQRPRPQVILAGYFADVEALGDQVGQLCRFHPGW